MSGASTVVFNLKADTAQLVKGLTKAQWQMTKTVRSMEKSFNSLQKNIVAIGGAYIGVQAAIKGFEKVAQQAMQMVNVAAQFEKFDATLRTLEGSAQAAQQSMEWIQDFASKTPFNIDKVTSSFISLKSYGLEPTDGLLRTLGDTSAAMGKDIQQAVEAMADAVVGENERLKEYGIRAAKIGDQIKYTWTNASGEMRQTIVDNNSAVIESTLEAIFNSKYKGAMEMQSHTWNGLISNLQDSWTIFQKNMMDSGVFDYLKAIVTVVGDYLKSAFGEASAKSGEFAEYVIDGIRSAIEGIGYAYDSLETFGDYFKVIGLTAELAFEGVMTAAIGLASGVVNVFESIVNGIKSGFEFLINSVISAINSVLDAAAALGVGSGGTLSPISLGTVDVGGSTLSSYADASAKVTAETWSKLQNATNDLMTTGSGQSFADSFLKKIDATYQKLKNQVSSSADKTDFGDAVNKIKVPTTTKTNTETLKDYVATSEDVANATKDVTNATKDMQTSVDSATSSISDFNDTLQSDSGDGGTYTIVNNVTDGMKHFNKIADTTDATIQNVTKSVERFSFAFSDKLMGAFENNINSLRSVYESSTSLSKLGYEDALAAAMQAKNALLQNPLDVNIGKQYTQAYNSLLSSVDSYLNPSNFANQSEYAFAQATVGSQISGFQQAAQDSVNVLNSMKDLLQSINNAFADGILTDEEKATIAGVADRVNANNDVLLGDTGVTGAINSQVYYDNTGLAKDASLVGSNSLSDYVQKLMGDGTKGVSLARIESTLPDLKVATGLDGEIANIKTNTADTKVAVDSSNIKGNNVNNLDKLKIKSVTTSYVYTYLDATGGYVGTGDTPALPYGASMSMASGEKTTYSYYAQGGFTGRGIGRRDETGEVPAGIVHAGEWVAPKWMIRENPALFGALEMHRLGKSVPVKHIDIQQSTDSNKTNQYLFVLADELKQMNRLLRRVTDGGEAMKTELVL